MFNFFTKNEPTALGIDVGSSAIKIVQISKKGDRAVLDTYGALALGPYAGTEIGRATQLLPEKIVEALLNLIREAKATSKKAGIAIPISSTLMFLADLPIVGDKELSTMVPLEARKYIPVPISEVTLDWSLVPRDEIEPDRPPSSQTSQVSTTDQGGDVPKKVHTQDVLIVAIHNDTIAKYQNIVKGAGLNVTFFEVELFSALRSTASEEVGTVMVIDIGAALTKLYVIERGIMRFSHTINRGSQDITFAISKSQSISVDKAEILKRRIGLMNEKGQPEISDVTTLVLDYIFSEAELVRTTYQRKYLKNVKKFILVGGGSALRGIADFAQAKLQTDVVIGDPFSKVETPAFLTDILKKTGPEFAVAMGLALRRLQEL